MSLGGERPWRPEAVSRNAETPLTPCCDGEFLASAQTVSQSAAPKLRRLASGTG
jgi:hypothetical protein